MSSRKALISALAAAGTLALVGGAFAGSSPLDIAAPSAGVAVGNTSAGNLEPAGSALRLQAIIDSETKTADHGENVPVQAAFGASAPAAPPPPSAPAVPVAASSAPAMPTLPSGGSSSAPSTPDVTAMVPPGVAAAANSAKTKAMAQVSAVEIQADPVAAKAEAQLAQMNRPSAPSLPSGPSSNAPAQVSVTMNANVSASGKNQSANQSIMLPPSSSSQ